MYIIILPGTITVLVPSFLLARNHAQIPALWGAPQYLGLLLVLLGIVTVFWCIWDFAAIGHGTPAPTNPPKVLVTRGLYQYVRNPLYIGLLFLLLGETIIFSSLSLLRFVAGYWIFVYLMVIVYEEPHLLRVFGQSYGRYRQSVNRWIPAKKGRHFRDAILFIIL
jgi:protein-S-isoprenylcysteine O-methyltransferase Ste14